MAVFPCSSSFVGFHKIIRAFLTLRVSYATNRNFLGRRVLIFHFWLISFFLIWFSLSRFTRHFRFLLLTFYLLIFSPLHIFQPFFWLLVIVDDEVFIIAPWTTVKQIFFGYFFLHVRYDSVAYHVVHRSPMSRRMVAAERIASCNQAHQSHKLPKQTTWTYKDNKWEWQIKRH